MANIWIFSSNTCAYINIYISFFKNYFCVVAHSFIYTLWHISPVKNRKTQPSFILSPLPARNAWNKKPVLISSSQPAQPSSSSATHSTSASTSNAHPITDDNDFNVHELAALAQNDQFKIILSKATEINQTQRRFRILFIGEVLYTFNERNVKNWKARRL